MLESLLINTSVNTITEYKPYAYQMINDIEIEVVCNYKLHNKTISFSFPEGYNKTLPLIFGVGLGYTILVILINYVLISTFKKYPAIQEVIRVLGTLFLIYLAYKISFSNNSSNSRTVNPVTFFDTFFGHIEKRYVPRNISKKVIFSERN